MTPGCSHGGSGQWGSETPLSCPGDESINAFFQVSRGQDGGIRELKPLEGFWFQAEKGL